MAGRAWRYSLICVGAVAVLAVGTVAAMVARFDPNSLKPRIAAAVQQATGRDLGLYGPVTVKWSLTPTLQLQDVTFANPPGYSRPQMATLQRLDLRLAVLPLISGRFEISRLVLVHPDILLEEDPQGHANWQFQPPANPAPAAGAPTGGAPAGTSPAPTGSKTGTEISFRDVQIEDGTLAWRNDRKDRTQTLALARLTAKSAAPDAPLTLTADATYNGVATTLQGQVGPLARLQQPAADTPWPVNLTLTAAGARLSVDGALTHPLQGRGYALALDATIPDLAAIAPLVPRTRLPPLHDVHLAARIADSGGPTPVVESASLHLGPADLGTYVSGLRVVSVDIDAPQQNQPVKLAARADLADTPLTLAATVGVPGGLWTATHTTGPVPLDLSIQAADASLTAKGTVAHPEALSGADLTIAATIPNLSTLSALADRTLPAVTQIALQGHLTDADGGFRHGATLQDLKLTTAEGDLSGTIGVVTGSPPTLTGNLHADRIDADALLAATGRPVSGPAHSAGDTPPQPSSKPPTAGTSPAAPIQAPSPATASPAANEATEPPTTPQRRGAGRLIPDTPLPFGVLHQANADLTLAVADLTTGGSDYRSINLHVLLQGGKLAIAPLSADLPEGRLDGTLSADATAAAPPIAITLHAPGLEVAPLLSAAGLPDYAAGRIEVYADLHGTGTTPHAIAAGLDGRIGLAMQNGTIDTQLLERSLGPVLQPANLLGVVSHGGTANLRCFALRADIHRGVADLRALTLNSSALSMDGSGSINLGDETLALRLRPQGRLGGTIIVVPMQVTGPIRSPGVKVNALGATAADVGSVAGTVLGKATPLGLLGGLLGGGKLLDAAAADSCAGPLAVARSQTASPAAMSNTQEQRK